MLKFKNLFTSTCTSLACTPFSLCLVDKGQDHQTRTFHLDLSKGTQKERVTVLAAFPVSLKQDLEGPPAKMA